MPIDYEGLRAALAGRYALERELGHGATATVYLARDLNVPKHVAIKVLNPDIALAVTTERFRREIKNAAPLTHPYILGITDAGVAFDSQTGGEILYYVMPYAGGGSLREPIAADGPLPVKRAVRIAWEVADALAYAHARGVIHRDIKPGNILLGEEHIWVADFGIARKLEDEGLTATGREPGTPGYMSPEQTVAAGADHRSDIYALGCVLYEMLAGRPPFEGPTVESLAVQRLSGPAPSVRRSRPVVPVWLDQVVSKALAQKPEERFQTAIEFRDALRLRAPWVPVAWRTAAAAAAVGGFAWGAERVFNRNGLTAADTLTYAVLPVAYADSAGAQRIGAALHDELAKWTGITVVDQQRVREEATGKFDVLTTSEALQAARRLKAGRYITVDASRFADLVRIRAVLHDGVAATPVRERNLRLRANDADTDASAAALIDGLLFTDSSAAGGTRSFQARQSYERGLVAVRSWDLDQADTQFVAATTHDQRYARAYLSIALVRYWNRSLPPTWESAAELAAAADDLSASEQNIARALAAFSRGDLPTACAVWRDLTASRADDFGSWFGLGTCLYADRVVLPDPRSPSGWRFRSSYFEALKSFQNAYRLRPIIHRRLRDGGFDRVRRLFMAGGGQTREGRSESLRDKRFFGRPFWDGDSLLFIPFDERDVYAGDPRTTAAKNALARQRLREMFFDVASSWHAAEPNSSSALEALAIGLELRGDPASLDTLRRARHVATDEPERLRLAASEAWMQLKFAIPFDVAGIRQARRLADSILDAATSPLGQDALTLASLAAVTGRATLAARLIRRGSWPVPGPIASAGPALLAFAALGGPLDSVRALEQQVSSSIDHLMVASERDNNRLEWLGRPSTLVFPAYTFASSPSLTNKGDYLIDAQAAMVAGDTARVRGILRILKTETRRWLPATSITFDALYPEATLLATIRDSAAAIEWMDSTLNAIAGTAPRILMDPARGGALARAIRLRADLAHQAEDRATASRWARVLAILWSDADEFLRDDVTRMEQLAR